MHLVAYSTERVIERLYRTPGEIEIEQMADSFTRGGIPTCFYDARKIVPEFHPM